MTVNRIQIHNKYDVSITRRDNGEIKRKSIAMTRKSKKFFNLYKKDPFDLLI